MVFYELIIATDFDLIKVKVINRSWQNHPLKGQKDFEQVSSGLLLEWHKLCLGILTEKFPEVVSYPDTKN